MSGRLLWIWKGYRVETWQNEGESLGLPVCIVACMCVCLSVCEVWVKGHVSGHHFIESAIVLLIMGVIGK